MIEGPSIKKHQSFPKLALRQSWRMAQLLHTFITASGSNRSGTPKVFYGGARSGDLGGPLVKLKRLEKFFPQHLLSYNIVYLLSNAPYVPKMGLSWLKRRGVPLVLNQNGVFYPGWYSNGWQKQNQIMAEAYTRSDYIFWQTNFTRRCADKFLGKNTGDGEILYNAVDTAHFSPMKNKSARPFVFLVTGKIDKHVEYRLSSTIEGFARLCQLGLDVRLDIAGWVRDTISLQHLIEKNRVVGKVRVLGAYTQDNAPDVYRGADAYVMTKYLDPCPNTVIEAMSCGLPILYSASGGVPELVGRDAGVPLQVPEDWETIHIPSAQSIAEGMLQIMDSASSMSIAARARAEREFDLHHWISRHQIIFEKLLQ